MVHEHAFLLAAGGLPLVVVAEALSLAALERRLALALVLVALAQRLLAQALEVLAQALEVLEVLAVAAAAVAAEVAALLEGGLPWA